MTEEVVNKLRDDYMYEILSEKIRDVKIQFEVCSLELGVTAICIE